MAKIGILGGTFHPIHNGHLYIAKQALAAFGFDELWILPAGLPPHKMVEGHISRVQRLKICEAAIADEPAMRIIPDEIFKTTTSYTYETLQAFHVAYPQHQFSFIIGEDSLNSFDSWVHPEIICQLADIVVAVRNDKNQDYHSLEARTKELSKKYGGTFSIIPSENMPISSTMLRKMLAEGADVSMYMPKLAYEYIKEHQLYQVTMEDDLKLRKEIQEDLKNNLKKSRYEHTLGVMYTACSLAMRYQYSMTKARFAGLLHDWAKYLSDEEQLAYCKKHHIEITPAEEQAPYLLHAKIGAYVAREKYGIDDEDVCHAILVHTTGVPNMNLLDKILFTADYIEPNRKDAPRLEDIRMMAFENLDTAVLMILEDSIKYIEDTKRPMDPTTMDTYEYYKTHSYKE